MINYTTAKSKEDLEGILSLQKANLAVNLSKEEIISQGFVTVIHRYEDLKKMNDIEQHVIAKDKGKVIAYLLAMTRYSKQDIPILFPMFELFEKLPHNGDAVASFNYLVVGQVCVDKKYRGQGVLDNCYAFYRDHFKQKYDFAITEIAASNTRSIKAHYRVGFREMHRYTGPDKVEWSIVVWNWKN